MKVADPESGRNLASRVHIVIALASAFFIGVQSAASPDRITYNGETWNDVLIYKSSTMYYVKVPDEGTIFNIPIDAVSPSNVEIVRNPYYRDELKARFDENARKGPRPSAEGVGTSVFNVAEIGGTGGEGETSAAEVAARDPLATIKRMLTPMGFTFTDDPSGVVARSADGSTRLLFRGGTPAGGIEYTSTVPDTPQAVQTQNLALGAIGNLAGQVAPWAPAFLQRDVAPLLESEGTAERTEGPLAMTAQVTREDGKMTLRIVATPVAEPDTADTDEETGPAAADASADAEPVVDL